MGITETPPSAHTNEREKQVIKWNTVSSLPRLYPDYTSYSLHTAELHYAGFSSYLGSGFERLNFSSASSTTITRGSTIENAHPRGCQKYKTYSFSQEMSSHHEARKRIRFWLSVTLSTFSFQFSALSLGFLYTFHYNKSHMMRLGAISDRKYMYAEDFWTVKAIRAAVSDEI